MRYICFFILLVLSTSVLGDAVLLDTDFSELPTGWYNDRWTFNNPGANAYYYSTGARQEMDMGSNTGGAQIIYFVPDGADSVVACIEHDLFAQTDEGTAHVWFYVSSTTTGGGYIYEQGIPWYTTFSDVQPIVYSIVDPPDGTWLGFSFHAEADADIFSGAEVDWTIYQFTVTAYGNSMTLGQSTWAGIKNLF